MLSSLNVLSPRYTNKANPTLDLQLQHNSREACSPCMCFCLALNDLMFTDWCGKSARLSKSCICYRLRNRRTASSTFLHKYQHGRDCARVRRCGAWNRYDGPRSAAFRVHKSDADIFMNRLDRMCSIWVCVIATIIGEVH